MRRAFTLIEVLVAMVIVALMSATGMFAYKMAIDQISRKEPVSFDDVMTYAWLRTLFATTYFYVVEKDTTFETEGIEYLYLFDTGDKSVRFVTTTPLFGHRLSLVKLSVENGQLLYEQSSIYDPKQDYKHPKILSDAPKIILIDNMENARFSYERYFALPNDVTSRIPKIVKFSFEKNGVENNFFFSVRYDYYPLKNFLKSRREAF